MLVLWSLIAICIAAKGGLGHASRSTTSDLGGLPNCASSCLSAAVQHSQCSATNQTCLCTNEALQTEANICISTSCSIKEALLTKNITSTNCNAPIRDKSAQFVTISNTFTAISSIFVMIRFGFKIWVGIELALDDWFALITMVVGIPNAVIPVHYIVPNGLGRDIWTLTYSNITNFSMFFYITAPFYFIQVALVKLSILFFYLRIFPAKPVRRILWGTIIFNCLFGAVFVIASIFQCKPISYFWTKWDGEHSGQCIDLNVLAWSNSGISIALDIWMLAIPLSQLKGLNLDWKKKVGGGIMFCVGTFVTVMSILRLRSLVLLTTRSQNPTWDYFEVSIWSVMEICVGIICACMPTMRLVLVRIFPRALGGSHRYYESNTSRRTGSQTRPTKTTITSNVHKSQQKNDESGITCHKSYTVEYGDNDEVQLIHIRNAGREAESQNSRSQVSF
ncbi:hypothetical protein BGZ63DRAFT_403848 [Mariannaea sp. PMI_226]|nr:hypothetical protein BGZ63DRAFT_403848 [Mariannaea sp. PMI_226]